MSEQAKQPGTQCMLNGSHQEVAGLQGIIQLVNTYTHAVTWITIAVTDYVNHGPSPLHMSPVFHNWRARGGLCLA